MGRDILDLVRKEVSATEPNSPSPLGALAAARSVILIGRFHPGADQLIEEERAAAARQNTVEVLESHLRARFTGNGEGAQRTLKLAAAYVALTGKECWDEAEAATLKGKIAPQLRRRMEMGDEPSLMIAAAVAPDFRLALGEEAWSRFGNYGHVITAAHEELFYRVHTALHVPAGLRPPDSTYYTVPAANLRVLQAVAIQRLPDDPARGIDIIDPPFTAYR